MFSAIGTLRWPSNPLAEFLTGWLFTVNEYQKSKTSDEVWVFTLAAVRQGVSPITLSKRADFGTQASPEHHYLLASQLNYQTILKTCLVLYLPSLSILPDGSLPSTVSRSKFNIPLAPNFNLLKGTWGDRIRGSTVVTDLGDMICKERQSIIYNEGVGTSIGKIYKIIGGMALGLPGVLVLYEYC